ncbi:MAG: hypothetical protein PHE25_02405 [Candidatus Gracilibacteria bacterium]|nr:hypothetical protein [Candidatus Gracilibacteria bacterium]
MDELSGPSFLYIDEFLLDPKLGDGFDRGYLYLRYQTLCEIEENLIGEDLPIIPLFLAIIKHEKEKIHSLLMLN